jgi:hypothetical protein
MNIMKTSKYFKLWLLVLATLPFSLFAQSETKLSIETFTINAGETQTMIIDLDNPDMEVTLVQFDLSLPEGLTVSTDDDALEIGRTTWKKHSLDANEDNTRFLLHSGKNNTLEGTSGAIIYIKLVAAATFKGGTIALRNIEIVSPTEQVVHPNDVEMTIGTTQTTVTIVANNQTMLYGDAVPTLTYTVTEGEADGTPELSCEATQTSPVGTYPIHITKGTLKNDVVNLTDGTLTINKAPLTITAKSYTIKQGEALPEFEVTYSGFKNGEDENVLKTKPTITCNATADSEPGSYEIIVDGADAANYDITYASGWLTIEKPVVIITDEQGSDYEVGEDNTVTFVSNTEATGTFEIPQTIIKDGVTYTVTAIAEMAFLNNTNLTEIVIPESITAIGGSAFEGCSNLASITIKSTTPPTVYDDALPVMKRASNAFLGVDKEKCILYVPVGCVAAYTAAEGWNEFHHILEIGTSSIHVLTGNNQFGNIYDINGRLVRENTNTFEGLSKGIYIVNGRKIIVK